MALKTPPPSVADKLASLFANKSTSGAEVCLIRSTDNDRSQEPEIGTPEQQNNSELGDTLDNIGATFSGNETQLPESTAQDSQTVQLADSDIPSQRDFSVSNKRKRSDDDSGDEDDSEDEELDNSEDGDTADSEDEHSDDKRVENLDNDRNEPPGRKVIDPTKLVVCLCWADEKHIRSFPKVLPTSACWKTHGRNVCLKCIGYHIKAKLFEGGQGVIICPSHGIGCNGRISYETTFDFFSSKRMGLGPTTESVNPLVLELEDVY